MKFRENFQKTLKKLGRKVKLEQFWKNFEEIFKNEKNFEEAI